MNYKIIYKIDKTIKSVKILGKDSADAVRKFRIVSAPTKIEVLDVIKTTI